MYVPARSPNDSELAPSKLFTRTFKPDKADFLRGIGQKLGKVAPTNSAAELQNFVREYFTSVGVKTNATPMAPETQARFFFFNDRTGMLLAHFPAGEFDKIEQAIDEAVQQGHDDILRASALRDALEASKGALASMTESLGPQHPEVVGLRRQIEMFETDLKQLGSRDALAPSLMVTVSNEGNEVLLDSLRVAFGDLSAELKSITARSPNRAAIIHADKDIPIEKLLKVTEALRKAKIENIILRGAVVQTHEVVNIQAKFLAAPSAAVKKLALGNPHSTDGNGTATWLLSPEQMSLLWNVPSQAAGFETLATPSITTEDGREAAMFVGAVTNGAFPAPKAAADNWIGNGTGFSVNAIGYVNVLKPDGKEIEDTFLIGPSLRVLPEIVGSEVKLTVEAKVTELPPPEELKKADKLGAGPPVKTIFKATTRGTIAEGGGLLLVGVSTGANRGTNYMVVVSATLGGK